MTILFEGGQSGNARGVAGKTNVISFRRTGIEFGATRDASADAFGRLTATLIMQRHTQGTLEPELLRALLAGVGLPT
jgi:hypothetical protein